MTLWIISLTITPSTLLNTFAFKLKLLPLFFVCLLAYFHLLVFFVSPSFSTLATLGVSREYTEYGIVFNTV